MVVDRGDASVLLNGQRELLFKLNIGYIWFCAQTETMADGCVYNVDENIV